MRFKNKCFLFKGKKDDIKANWTHARSWCREQGGDLAVIDNQYENGELLLSQSSRRRRRRRRRCVFNSFGPSFTDFVSSYLRDLMFPTWIGLSDLLAEDQYAWSDGVSPVLYTNWNDKEPNNAGGTVRMF